MQPPELERFGDYLDLHAERSPKAEAAVLGNWRLSYAELAARVEACARALLASGLAKGDRVAVLTTPRPEYLIVFLALARIGAVWVGLNPRYTRAELDFIVGDAEPSLLIGLVGFENRDYRDDLAALLGSHPSIRRLLTVAGAMDGATPFEAFLGEGASTGEDAYEVARAAVTLADPLCIVYTSGTTGTPKGAMLSHRSFVRCYTTQYRHWPVDPLRTLSNLPVNHIGGVGDIGGYCLVGGGAQVFMERFDPQGALETIERERVTVWLQMVSQFQRVAALPDFDRRDLSSLELVAWGDAVMPVPLVRRLKSKAPRVTNSYGLSEACGPLTYVDSDASLEVLSQTIGRPAAEFELRLADADGATVPAGKPGEIQVRGDFVMSGYFRRPEATAQALDAQGWLHTGDLAVERPDGNWQIVGRLKEMFKSGGYNVYPREIETVIEAHPQVDLAAVVGLPDPVFQEVGHAFVLCADDADIDANELEAFCRERLANYKVPKRFYLRDAFPLLSTGKVDKARLREEALSALRQEAESSE